MMISMCCPEQSLMWSERGTNRMAPFAADCYARLSKQPLETSVGQLDGNSKENNENLSRRELVHHVVELHRS
jgi:hypothetical protein